MYGLTQAVNTANDKLKQHLSKFSHEQEPITPGLWWNQTRPVQFSLVVDDFGVQYEHQNDITHLLDELNTIYSISQYWEGKPHFGMSL